MIFTLIISLCALDTWLHILTQDRPNHEPSPSFPGNYARSEPKIALKSALAVSACEDGDRAAVAEMGGANGGFVKGGDDRTGPYDPVPGWWKAAPDHDNEWGWGQVAGVAVDHADRIIVVTRGDWPADGSVPRAGRLRRTNFVVVANANGEIVEQWAQWDSIFTLPHQVYISPYDPDRHVWVIDSGGGEGHMQVVKFTNDGSEIVMRLGERDHPKTREAARARSDLRLAIEAGVPS